MSIFESVKEAPPDPIFGVNAAFEADTRSFKVNLGIGVYRTAALKVPLLSTVHAAERLLAEQGRSRSYLPIDGDRLFVELTKLLVFGEACAAPVYGAQTPGSTGALRIAGELLKMLGKSVIYVSSPTWSNHRSVFAACGLKVELYDYYDRQKKMLQTEKMYASLRALPEGAAILFHASCHNPTGVQPTVEEWKQIHTIVAERGLVVVFDCAYQGLGDGIEEDSAAVRYFVERGTSFLLCYSYAKNLSIYAERAGAFFAFGDASEVLSRVGSQVRAVVRTLYSTPPAHGAALVRTVLQDAALKGQWLEELRSMRVRIQEMRKSLMAGLLARAQGQDFSFLGRQKGLFSYTGLEKAQVERLCSEFAIYMPTNGRINVTGLNSENLDYVVEAIASVL